MKNSFLRFTFLLLSIFTLSSCSSGPAPENLAPLSYPNLVHPTLSINVLSYKLINDSSQVPALGNPPNGRKFLAIHLIVANPGKHNGLPASQFASIIDQIEIRHPSNPSVSYGISSAALSEPLESYNGQAGLSGNDIAPSKSISGWVIGSLPKDLNPPLLVKFIPFEKLKPSREFTVKLE